MSMVFPELGVEDVGPVWASDECWANDRLVGKPPIEGEGLRAVRSLWDRHESGDCWDCRGE